jgi:hypothetical protein
MPRDINTFLDEVQELATLMAGQIEWAALADRSDEDFMKEVTERFREQQWRDAAKRVIEGLVQRLRANALLVEAMDGQTVPAAAELVAKAVKAIVAVQSPANRWVTQHYLIIKFEPIQYPWRQDDHSAMERSLAAALGMN